ncbi:carboxypeptidase family protein [Hephaestia caeni]|uniref:Carboxypeptidase family protein n=1 Tax=Hephaestia caeni TaxID=645617 RepID=A0A397P2Q8_9SPHN|nr:TonB-dependent receptor [Hephaestia caeni]RIA43840.1 carboxypeptidase family protein [Hephaestia caeni]
MMFNTKSSRGLRLHFAAALLIGTASAALIATPAHAQVSAASLRGTITEGGEATATSVTIVETATGYRRTAPVSANGQYNFPSLRPGTYRLEVTTPSGVRNTDTFTLQVAQNAQLNFDLAETAPETASTPGEDITGGDDTGGAIIVTASKLQSLEGGEVGAVVSQRMIEQLPQNNRNFLAFADIAPGVQFITGSNGNSRIQGGAQDSRTVNIYIDGVGQKDYVLKNGITGQDSTQGNPFPQLAVGEYRVISSNYKAEFDQVSSVAITAVTKSGTNQFHGEGFFDFTNQDLREKIPDEVFNSREKVKTKDMQFGGALGGPIIKDVAHFFVTYEGKRQQVPVEITPGTNFPISYFPAEYQGYFGTTNRTFNEDLYFGKIDIVPTASDLFEFSGKYRNESGENLNSGSSARETLSLVDTKEWRGLGRWQHSADTWINDFKVAYEDVHWAPQPDIFEPGSIFVYDGPNPNDPGGDSVRGTILRIGGSPNYQNKGQKGWTVSDDFTYTGLVGHTIKAGVKAKWVKLNAETLNNFNPQYTYNPAFNPGGGGFNDTIPYTVQFAANTGNGDPVVRSKNFQLGLYLQDDWEVTDRLTLNLGVRWDYEETPSYLNFVTPADAVAALTNWPNIQNTDYDINDYISTGNNRHPFKGAWQPRLGFTYELDDAGRFAVFGGYGRSYDRNQFDFLQQEISTGAFTTRTFNFITGDPANTCSPSATCVPWDPIYLTEEGRQQLLAGTGPAGARELHLVNNDLKVPYSDQFSLGVRGRFGLWQPEIGYSHIESHDGFAFLLGNRDANGNFFIYNATTGEPGAPFGFPPPGFGSLLIGKNGIETKADSAYFKVVKDYTPTSPWSFNATYTYTEAVENRQFGETFAFDFPDFGGDNGYPDSYPFARSAGVRKHRLVMTGSVDLPLAFALSGKFQIASPPYFASFVRTGGTNPSLGVISNEADGNGDRWGLRQLDLALTKYFPLHFVTDETQVRLRVDVINVFNDRNYVNYFTNPNEDRYLQRNGYGVGGNPPRTIKLTAGFSF